MNFADHPPSMQWSVLRFRGETIAEVWFKPPSQPNGILFRIPRASFQRADIASLLSGAFLLRGVGIAVDEADGDASHWSQPMAPPPSDAAHIEVCIPIKPLAANEPREAPVAASDEPPWQELQARWRTILGLEANIDVLSQRVDSLRGELETALRTSLAPDERVHALNADVAQWNKAKSRAHFSIPKAKEFVHRVTWSLGTPERKQLEEIYRHWLEPQRLFPEIAKVPEQLDYLLKQRQLLSAQGVSVSQECQSVLTSIQSSLRTLKSNAAANAAKKRSSSREKGKHF